MAKKNALGRGLGALIDSEEEKQAIVEKISGVTEIPVDSIETNPFQPRSKFDEEALEELASSIKEIGIIQPITVREKGNGEYQLITGERRLKATKLAGMDVIPAYIRSANDQDMLEMALVENIQREDLDAIEVAISYQRLMEECRLTQEVLSQRVGKKRATVTNYLRLLKLPAEVQLGIREKKLSMGHARSIVSIEKPESQLKIFHKIVNEELSVRKVEELVRKMSQPQEEKENPVTTRVSLPKEYDDLKNHLEKFFETRVDFKRNDNGSGKIVIPFKTDDDLERIVGILDKLNS